MSAEQTGVFRALQALVAGLLRLLGDLRIDGRDSFPATGPYIVVTNHLHWLDVPIAFVTLRHQAAGIAGRQWTDHPVIGFLGRLLGRAIPVQKDSDHRAMGDAIRLLRAGGVLGLAPEGSRSRTGALQRGRPGAAYLASRTGAPVVPVATWGQERAFADLLRMRRPRLRVRVGPPFVLPGTPNRARAEALDAYTYRIMREIAVLLPPEYRGEYASPEQASDR